MHEFFGWWELAGDLNCFQFTYFTAALYVHVRTSMAGKLELICCQFKANYCMHKHTQLAIDTQIVMHILYPGSCFSYFPIVSSLCCSREPGGGVGGGGGYSRQRVTRGRDRY